jgi:predicted MFS family arabinose efflux permease
MTSGGFSSLIPRLVGRDGLARANTVDALTFNFAAMGGPAVGGVVAAVFGPAIAVATLGGCALLAIVATLLIPLVPARTDGDTRPALLTTVRTGLRHLVDTPPLRGTTLASVLSYGFVGMLVVALPERAFDLGVSRGDAGFVWAAAEVGGALAVLLVNRRLRRFAPERIVFVSVTLYGVVLAGWTVCGTFVVLVGLAVVAGFVEGPTLPAVFVARQRYSPRPLLAQVSTTGASLKIGAFAVGAAVGGHLVGTLGADRVILVVAAGQIIAAGAGWLSARVRVDDSDPR